MIGHILDFHFSFRSSFLVVLYSLFFSFSAYSIAFHDLTTLLSSLSLHFNSFLQTSLIYNSQFASHISTLLFYLILILIILDSRTPALALDTNTNTCHQCHTNVGDIDIGGALGLAPAPGLPIPSLHSIFGACTIHTSLSPLAFLAFWFHSSHPFLASSLLLFLIFLIFFFLSCLIRYDTSAIFFIGEYSIV